ncbi:MAG: TonB-dependent receptor plug domain-containing protein, partial [Opitutaceae bacterium]
MKTPNRSAALLLRGALQFIVVQIAATIAFSLDANAQTVAPSAPDSAALKKYDKNQNGRLDADELAAQQADEASATRAVVVTPNTSGEENKETIALSPFEVRADQDKGYYGANTMSGTRLNSKLEDLAASITVVTKQQLIDTAAVDINDVFLYEANTEGSGQFTAFGNDLGGVGDSVQGNPQGANRVRGMGGANQSRGNFAALGEIPIDTYNIDSVEISRGPNSNIFGLGNGSGTVNIRSSRARLDKASNQFSLRTDDRGSFRSTFDFNRPLGKQLSVRVLGVYDDVGYTRKPSKDITRRGTAAFAFQPFKLTKIRGSYESYHSMQRRPNYVTPRDNITPWIEAGRPTWDPVTFTAKRDGVAIGTFTTAQNASLPAGLWSQGRGMDTGTILFYEPNGLALWTVPRLTTTTNPYTGNTNSRYLQTGSTIVRNAAAFPLFFAPGISDKSLYDWSSINSTARNYTKAQADIFTLEIEQFLINTPTHVLAASAGWYREDLERYSNIVLAGGAGNNVVIDVNERMLDGTPNPYFLRPYISGTMPTEPITRRPVLNDNTRAQLAYQLDLTQQPGWRSWGG